MTPCAVIEQQVQLPAFFFFNFKKRINTLHLPLPCLRLTFATGMHFWSALLLGLFVRKKREKGVAHASVNELLYGCGLAVFANKEISRSL